MMSVEVVYSTMFFFFNDTATTEIYTLSLHDALPICFLVNLLSAYIKPKLDEKLAKSSKTRRERLEAKRSKREKLIKELIEDRKSTRLNSSHANISYAVFCLKKKKKKTYTSQLHQ